MAEEGTAADKARREVIVYARVKRWLCCFSGRPESAGAQARSVGLEESLSAEMRGETSVVVWERTWIACKRYVDTRFRCRSEMVSSGRGRASRSRIGRAA